MNVKKWIGSAAFAAIMAAVLAPAGQAAPLNEVKVEEPAKNVIMMIPDGMSVDAVALTRWYNGGQPLNMDEIATGMVRTHSSDAPIADSAPAGTAMATGYKSHTGFIGVLPDENTLYGTQPLAEGDKRKPVANVREEAQSLGKATGIVSTSEVMHATPADFSAHDPSRKNYDNISEQQVYAGMDVVLGGGSSFFEGENRKDGTDLLPVIQEKYQYVTTKEEMNQVKSGKLWGLFAPEAMAYDMDRPAEQPSLAEMTQKAIDILSQDEDGFFLMVEGSKVDWAAHANDPVGMISDVNAFDKAVGVALDFAKRVGNTLVIAATDHGNSGISIGNEATSGNYDKRPLADFITPLKQARLTGEGIETILNSDRSNAAEALAAYGITDPSQEELQAVKEAKAGTMNGVVGHMMAKRANIGFTTGGHTGGDVTLYVYAPENITTLSSVVDNTDIGKYVAKAMGVDLAKISQERFVLSRPAFTAKGADVIFDTTDHKNPSLRVIKGDKELILPINTNQAILNGKVYELEGVTVFNGINTYVTQEALNLIG